MHELSIAESLIEQVRRHTPSGARATVVRVESGPLQAIDPEALRFAWQALTSTTELDHSSLEFTALPWSLICSRCGKTWNSTDPFERCAACGSDAARPEGSGELRLISIEVESADLSLQSNNVPAEI